jgi:hypothetical protein
MDFQFQRGEASLLSKDSDKAAQHGRSFLGPRDHSLIGPPGAYPSNR